MDVGANFLDNATELVAKGEGQVLMCYGVRRRGDNVGATKVFVKV